MLEAGGSTVFNVDTTNSRVGINEPAPVNDLSVSGNTNITGHSALGSFTTTVNDGSLIWPGNSFDNVVSVQEILTNPAVDFAEGITSYINLNPSAAPSYQAYAVDGEVETNSSNAQNFALINGVYGAVKHSGSGTVSFSIAATGLAYNAGSGDVTNQVALSGQAGNLGTGTVTNNVGLNILSAFNSGGGVLTNNYGILVQDQTGIGSGFNANIYSSGATSLNVFEGQIGVGTFTPGNKVEIDSGVANTSGLRFSNLLSTSPTTPTTSILGVDANGDVVNADASSIATVACPAGGGTTNVICQNGNTLGATIVVGSNDANNLAFETTGTTRFSLAAASSTLTGQGTTILDATGAMTLNSATTNALTLDSGTTGSINIGTNANAKTITFGNAGVATNFINNSGVSTTTADALNVNSVTTGAGLAITGNAVTSGDLLNISSSSTGAFGTDGAVDFNFSGAHTGTAFGITDSAATSGTVQSITANALTTGVGLLISNTSITTGNAIQVIGPGSNNMFRVNSLNGQAQDFGAVTIGQGAGSKPDTLARDQLYVFGRINSSWNMYWQDFVSRSMLAQLTADGVAYNAVFDEATGASGGFDAVTLAGTSGVALLDNPTSPAANENEWFGTNGAFLTQRSLNPVFEARILGDAVSANQRALAGFADLASGAAYGADTNQANNEIFFRKNGAAGTWDAVTRSAAGAETVTALATTTTAFHILRIEVDNTNGQARFYADGALVATHTTGLPAAATRLGWYIGNSLVAAANKQLFIDYVRVWSDDPVNQTVLDNTETVIDNQDGSITVNYNVDSATSDNPGNIDNGELLDKITVLEDRINTLENNVQILSTSRVGEAVFNGGIVSEDTIFKSKVTFEAITTFRGQSIFVGDSTFDSNVKFNGDITVNENGAGTATIAAGQNGVHITFSKPLVSVPVVTATPSEFIDGQYKVSNITISGFNIVTSVPQTKDSKFNWTAIQNQ